MSPADLAPLALFNGLTPEQLDFLTPLFRRVWFRAKDTAFAEKEPADNLYVLETGEVALRFTPDDGEPVEFARLRAPGDVFGWSAALGRETYTARATCLTAVQALAVRGADFRRLLHARPSLGTLLLERMAQTVAGRFRSARPDDHAAVRSGKSTVLHTAILGAAK